LRYRCWTNSYRNLFMYWHSTNAYHTQRLRQISLQQHQWMRKECRGIRHLFGCVT
uniref:SCP domain-containing protein n=1 Tax=Haemonchus placei TaxID=6290 RepID=A0A0N4VUM8_HAEPC